MDRLNLSGLQDPSSFQGQLQEVIGEKPELQPISRPVYQGESKVDEITLKEYRYQNGLGEFIGLTLAEPKSRKWPNPVIAVHQTNECGRKEIFGQGENPFLDYGLSLARRGHRVFAIDLFLTGERNPTNPWNPHPFYEKYPRWSVVGKDILDLTDLSYIINDYFNETEKINCIGHSQGGLVGIFFAAIENDRVSRLVANAAYFGKTTGINYNPWQHHILYNNGFFNNDNRQVCIVQNMDSVVSLAAKTCDTLLVVYSRDKIIEKSVPSDEELERMKYYSNGLGVAKFDLGHIFPGSVQDACFYFLEKGVSDWKDSPIFNLAKPLVLTDAIKQMEYLLELFQRIMKNADREQKITLEHQYIVAKEEYLRLVSEYQSID